MSVPLSMFFLILLLLLELAYFKLAEHFKIIDRPNARSLHSELVIRGGGIVFTFAVLLYGFWFDWTAVYFIAGLFAIATISFIDDLLTLNNKIRLGVHLMAVGLLFLSWDLFSMEWYWLVLALVFVIAAINAYNFMDGINGITGGYSLVAVLSLIYLNETIAFAVTDMLLLVGLSLLVFLYFNFRKKARAFAGDVGSVGIAFILVYFIGLLILKTGNFSYIGLLLLYGMDAVTTVVFRVIRGENITQAHRSHFYQFLVHSRGWQHLQVTGLYMLVQLLVNYILFVVLAADFWAILGCCLGLTLGFVLLRFYIEGRKLLLSAS